MKFETFKAGRWTPRYQYKSFEPVPVNREWTWENPTINALLEQANALIKALINKNILVEITGRQRGRVYAFQRYLDLFTS